MTATLHTQSKIETSMCVEIAHFIIQTFKEPFSLLNIPFQIIKVRYDCPLASSTYLSCRVLVAIIVTKVFDFSNNLSYPASKRLIFISN